MVARQGRRPGNPDTRETILQAARSAFAANGFASTSIRQIANAAAVDPALIHHYFGSKEKLFLATVRVGVDIRAKIAEVGASRREDLGRVLIRTLITTWDSDAGISLVAAFRAALADPMTSRMVREFLTSVVLAELAAVMHLAPGEAPQRAGLIASQVVGLITARYLLALEPLASMPVESIVAAVGPTIERYLTGDIS